MNTGKNLLTRCTVLYLEGAPTEGKWSQCDETGNDGEGGSSVGRASRGLR